MKERGIVRKKNTVSNPLGGHFHSRDVLGTMCTYDDLSKALVQGDLNRVYVLLGDGPDLNQPMGKGATPLNELIRQIPLHRVGEKQEAPIEVFVDRGADSNGVGLEGETPLHWGVLRAEPQVIAMLLEAGASVHPANWMGNTPLHLIGRKDLEAVNY